MSEMSNGNPKITKNPQAHGYTIVAFSQESIQRVSNPRKVGLDNKTNTIAMNINHR
jgi:hypothetical protein